MKTSATSVLIERIPKILNRKVNENGLTFDELWEQLKRDKVAEKYLKNDKNEWRYGLLQGISTRVKQDKIAGISIIKTEAGNKWFAVDDKFFLKMNEFKRHLDVLTTIKFVEDSNKDNAKLNDLDTKIAMKLTDLTKLSDEIIAVMKKESHDNAKVIATDSSNSKKVETKNVRADA
ncbi:hypothetical protein [Companilactobacillus sp. FL22-1]|uniref:hypothetical protein n=1 Tax=Companilactobacillus sp. FL22-1 TaxID=3373892 RepID=UPI003754BEFB